LDQAESKVKDLEIVNSKLANSLNALQYDCTTLKLDKEELELEVSRRRKEADSGAHFEALELWNKMSAATLEIKRIETEMVQLRLEKATLQKEKSDLVEQLEKSAKRNEMLDRERKDMIAYKSELDESYIRIDNLQKIESKLEQEVRELKRELSGATENLVSEVSRLKEENANFKSLNDSLSTALDKLTYEKNDKILISVDEYSLYQSQVVQSKSTQAALFESERRRRELHNKLQDIRGNIRVFVRCRPFLEADVLEEIRAGVKDANVNNMQPCLAFLKDESSVCIAPTALGYLSSSLRNTKGMLGSPNQPFVFDKTFGKDATQGDVYNEVSELVQSALDGYRVCILSYGQSGSGKVR
jgi:kinesin family protein C1